MENTSSKDFIFNFWLNTENPDNLPQQINGYIFQLSQQQYITLNFKNNIPLLHYINCNTLQVEGQFQLDISECPIINYDFLHKKAFLINNRIYLISCQHPRENCHIYIIDIQSKRIFPVKNIDTKPLEFRINSSVELYNYKLIFFGGFNEQMQLSNTLESFDISTYRWEKIATRGKGPCARHSATCCLYQDRLILFGGSKSMNVYSNDKQCKDLYILDLKSSVWIQIKTEDLYIPQIVNYTYIQPIYIDIDQKLQKFIYVTKNPQNGEFLLCIFNPQNNKFHQLDVYSQKPEFRLGCAVVMNHYTQELIIVGGFKFNKEASESLCNSLDRLALFKEDNPELFEKLNIMGGKTSKQNLMEFENPDDELYEETNQDLELTFEELLEMEKQLQQNKSSNTESQSVSQDQEKFEDIDNQIENQDSDQDSDDGIIDPTVLLNNIPQNTTSQNGNKKKRNKKKKNKQQQQQENNNSSNNEQ